MATLLLVLFTLNLIANPPVKIACVRFGHPPRRDIAAARLAGQ